jgi:hypothetical protein
LAIAPIAITITDIIIADKNVQEFPAVLYVNLRSTSKTLELLHNRGEGHPSEKILKIFSWK